MADKGSFTKHANIIMVTFQGNRQGGGNPASGISNRIAWQLADMFYYYLSGTGGALWSEEAVHNGMRRSLGALIQDL